MSSALQGLKVESLVEQYQGLLEVSEAIISHRDLSELFQVLAERLRPLVDFDYVNVILHDAARNMMRMRLMETPNEKEFKPEEWEFTIDEAPSGWVWQHQQPLVVNDIKTETRFPRVIEFMRGHGVKCFCVLPLTSAGRRLGTLGFGREREGAYSDADIKFLGQVAKQVAVAVDNALNFEGRRKRDVNSSTSATDCNCCSPSITPSSPILICTSCSASLPSPCAA